MPLELQLENETSGKARSKHVKERAGLVFQEAKAAANFQLMLAFPEVYQQTYADDCY